MLDIPSGFYGDGQVHKQERSGRAPAKALFLMAPYWRPAGTCYEKTRPLKGRMHRGREGERNQGRHHSQDNKHICLICTEDVGQVQEHAKGA